MVADDPESFADLDGHENAQDVHANSNPCTAGNGVSCDDMQTGANAKKDQPATQPQQQSGAQK